MRQLVAVLFITLLPGFAVAQFHEQGFQGAVSRTDYDSQTKGLASNPLTYVAPCLYSGEICGTGPTSYSSSHAFFQHSQNWPESDYWVLSINNEDSYDKYLGGVLQTITHNSGPPNQSLPKQSRRLEFTYGLWKPDRGRALGN